jgi:hypothetical protein
MRPIPLRQNLPAFTHSRRLLGSRMLYDMARLKSQNFVTIMIRSTSPPPDAYNGKFKEQDESSLYVHSFRL